MPCGKDHLMKKLLCNLWMACAALGGLGAQANPRSLTHFHPTPPLLVDGIQYRGPKGWVVYMGEARLTPQNPTHQGWTLTAVTADHVTIQGYGETWTVRLYGGL